MTAPLRDASLEHLLGRLELVEARVRAAVADRRNSDLNPDDPFRGLYLSAGHVEQLLQTPRDPPLPDPESQARLTAVESRADAAEERGDLVRLRRLARTFGLEPLDVELLLVALAPDLDDRFERLYGYLHDDLTRRRPSVGLAYSLCNVSASATVVRRRLSAGAPLIDGGLLVVEEPRRPFLSRPVRVPDRVVGHLLGDDHPDPLIAPLLTPWIPASVGDPAALGRVIQRGGSLCYLRERPGAGARSLGMATFSSIGAPAVALDLTRLSAPEDAGSILAAALREARLRDAGLVVGPIEPLVDHGLSALRELADAAWPIILTGGRAWDPAWARRVPLTVDVESLTPAARTELWRAHLAEDPPGLDDVTTQFRLGPEQVGRAAVSARLHAVLADRELRPDDLRAGARTQNSVGLEHLARRIEPSVGWDDLVLPAEGVGLLRELSARARHRYRVLDDWGLRRGGARGEGIAALFAGESGTGKTMAAEVVAGALGLDLYTINLATVIDKYIGETEKNLERIFVEAEDVNGVLFFDEADALFGKRSEVSDAHDRYANVEVAYLLQRMETFEGVAILATNLRGNVDEAFTRRLATVVDFPMPDEASRLQLWERALGPKVPRGPDLDLQFCARAFELSGGNIRNIGLTAAFLAAEGDGPVGMRELMRATQGEYRKMGRLCVPSEFGAYYELLTEAS